MVGKATDIILFLLFLLLTYMWYSHQHGARLACTDEAGITGALSVGMNMLVAE